MAEAGQSAKATEFRAWLSGHRAQVERERRQWARRESRWSLARLLLFLIALASWPFWDAAPLLPILITLTCASLFVGAVRCHQTCRAAREQHDRMLVVLDESARRGGGRVELIRSHARPADAHDEALAVASLLPTGPTWRLTDQERDDLDLYAPPVGLFGLLNRTSTPFGARRLRDWLDHLCLSAERIEARQRAVRWLETHPAERVRLMAGVAALRDEDRRLTAFARAVHAVQALRLFLPAAGLRAWSLFSAALFVAALAKVVVGDFVWGWLLVAVLAANGLILRRIGPGLAAALQPWQDVAWAASGLLVAARQATRDLPGETDLAKLQGGFAAVADREVLPSLVRRIGWADRGGFVHGLLNYTALYDLHAASIILHRVLPHRPVLCASLSALADLEALLSLACFAAEQPLTCYPTPTNSTALEISDGVHPLIPPERVVANSVKLTPITRMWIVTGSNMAGKSTLLRLTGVNVLLAQIGSAVTAREMRWRPLRLMTDLRARDNLAENESYFLAEVRHLRRVVLPPDGDGLLLGLIDEPFRGTNSQEQSAASVAVLRHLLKSCNLFLLATHDPALTDLADGTSAANYHFRENLTEAGLTFDYRLHGGPAQTRNALRVLEREGYPAAVLHEACACLAQQPGASEPVEVSAIVPQQRANVPSTEPRELTTGNSEPKPDD